MQRYRSVGLLVFVVFAVLILVLFLLLGFTRFLLRRWRRAARIGGRLWTRLHALLGDLAHLLIALLL